MVPLLGNKLSKFDVFIRALRSTTKLTVGLNFLEGLIEMKQLETSKKRSYIFVLLLTLIGWCQLGQSVLLISAAESRY
jgi:hypothetical protein